MYKFTNPLALTFLVVKGPNNLIGRHSLARLWPREFERFREATCENFKIGNTESKSNSYNQINLTKVDGDNSELKSKAKSISKAKPKPNSGKQGGDLKAKALPAKINAREVNRPAPVSAPPPPPSSMPLQPAQTGFDAGTPGDASDVIWPPRRPLPKLPDGEITQAVGAAYCKKLCAFTTKYSTVERVVLEGLQLLWF